MKILLYILSLGTIGFFSLKTTQHKSTSSQKPEIEIQSGKTTAINHYSPDNNPITYDENPANYPLYRPKTYENTFNEEVQSPTHYNSIPNGACAVCRDGSYSFSRNRRGTCSHHGGVSRWLK